MQGFTERGGWWVAAQGVLLAAVVTGVLMYGSDWGLWSQMAGWTLVAAGGVLGGWGLVSLGPNLTPYPHPLPHAEIVAHGPYRLVRHPIYGGIILGSTGLGVADGNLLVIGLAVGLLALFTGKAAFEERRLVAHDPGYATYRASVRKALIPLIW
ncbi:isoprenylcysteine carboxylmethyltransferase family protein [bacterium]|nr:isoprenylcysteine carboxylmethyltransferase family protein [bacterium]